MGSIISCVPKKNNKRSDEEISKKNCIHTYKLHDNQNSRYDKSLHDIQQNKRTILYLLSTYNK